MFGVIGSGRHTSRRCIAGYCTAVLAGLPAAAGERPDLERAYFQLICMRAVQARLDTSDDAAARTEMLADQAWVAVEVSTMTPDRIERLHAAAEAQSLEFEAFHQCITARLPE